MSAEQTIPPQNGPPENSSRPAVAALRRWMRPAPPAERCDLCGVALAAEHSHLFERQTRRVACSCDACAMLFGDGQNARFCRIPRRIVRLQELELADSLWQGLGIPVNLAFFFYSTAAARAVALYPSPAGATEAGVEAGTWSSLASSNQVLARMLPDVEALLVNRGAGTAESYLVPIDECFRLVGLVRMQWRGLSGGTRVWGEIGRFFDDLRRRSSHLRPLNTRTLSCPS